MEIVEENIVARLEVLGYLTLISFMVSWMAWKYGFYRFVKSPSQTPSSLSFKNIFTIYALFLGIQLIVIPLLFLGWTFLKEGKGVNLHTLKMDALTQGWMNLLAIGLLLFALGIYCSSLTKQGRQSVWGLNAFKGVGQGLKDFLFGAATWIICFPIIAWLGQAINIILSLIYQGPYLDQVAVKHLKSTFSNPGLFWGTVAAIVFIVPLIEELLFRGFLQTWLKGIFGRTKAIAAAAALFSLFHFSLLQGIANIELVTSLFILGCYLGFIFERQQSLWAPIGLHSIFNAISIWMILKTIG